MPETLGKTDDDIAALEATVQIIFELIQKSQKPSTNHVRNPININALDLAHDTASLIRAHSTKLSLLISNTPFTASAVTKVLQELIAGPIPSLSFAVELCNPIKYSQTIRKELDFRVKKLLSEIRCLVEKLPLNSRDVGINLVYSNDNGSKEFPVIIGTIWQSCDGLMELKKIRTTGIFIKKVEEYGDLLKDALEELHEWATEESDSEPECHDEDISNNSSLGLMDKILFSPKHIPADDVDGIRTRLQLTSKKLRLITLMFQAVIKRRLKNLPSLPLSQNEISTGKLNELHICKDIDLVLDMMRKISDFTDDLASSFYDLDVQQIDFNMSECFSTGYKIAEILFKNWEGKPDNFSTWLSNFQKELVSDSNDRNF